MFNFVAFGLVVVGGYRPTHKSFPDGFSLSLLAVGIPPGRRAARTHRRAGVSALRSHCVCCSFEEIRTEQEKKRVSLPRTRDGVCACVFVRAPDDYTCTECVILLRRRSEARTGMAGGGETGSSYKDP